MAFLKTGLLTAVAAGIVFTGLASGGDDTTPPELKSLRFTPESIDTSTSTADVTITFTVTDDASGANYFEASFIDSTGVGRQYASARFAPTLSATHSVKVAFPRFSISGTWKLSHVFLSDSAGNTLVLDADEISRRGFPSRLEVRSAQDTVSPKLASLEITPSVIDTNAGPANVKVNFTATDDLSGVSDLQLSFVSPSGVARQSGTAKFEAAQSVSKSLTVTFPRLSEPGQWTLSAVFLSDAARNTLILDAEGLVRAGFKTNLEVKSASDTTPPRLTGLRFTPEAINIRGGPATVKVDFTATDDLSGVSDVQLSFLSPSGNAKQGGVAKFDPAKSVSKSIEVTFPPRSEAGQWTLNTVFVADAAGNTLVLDAEGVVRAGLKRNLEVRSASDTTPPRLTAINFSPDAIDTSQGPATVKVDFTATGASAVKSFDVVFVSPSRTAIRKVSAAFPPATEVTGSVEVSFPQSSEPGAWTVGSVIVSDEAGNTLVLNAETLASRLYKTLQVR
jgi:hypothetical protein